MKHGYLLSVHDESVTSKFPASQDIRLPIAVYAINMSITNAFPPESRETPVLYVERRTTMLNQVAHLVGVAYVNLRLPPTWWYNNHDPTAWTPTIGSVAEGDGFEGR